MLVSTHKVLLDSNVLMLGKTVVDGFRLIDVDSTHAHIKY
jgi:hypothetical protein